MSFILTAPFLVEVAYLYCLFLFLSSSSILLFWLFMEVNLCIILVLLCKKNLSDPSMFKYNLGIYYFIVQSLGTMIFLLSSLLMDLFPSNIIQFLIALSLTLKAGLWPFHLWFYNFTLLVPPFMFLLMLTLQKFPLLLMVFILGSQISSILLVLNMIMGVFYLFHSKSNLSYALISSSIYSVLWIYLFYTNNFMMYLYFFFSYSVSILFFCGLKAYSSYDLNSNFKLSLMCGILFLLSLPPFGMFFLKLSWMCYINIFMSEVLMTIIWLVSFFSLISYMSIFYSLYLSQTNTHNSTVKFMSAKMNKTYILLMFTSLFFFY